MGTATAISVVVGIALAGVGVAFGGGWAKAVSPPPTRSGSDDATF